MPVIAGHGNPLGVWIVVEAGQKQHNGGPVEGGISSMFIVMFNDFVRFLVEELRGSRGARGA